MESEKIDGCGNVYYSLKRVGGKSKDGTQLYRAAVERDDKLDVLKDVEGIRNLGLRPENVGTVVGGVLDYMVREVMKDGVTRTLGGLIDVRMDIKGKFERPDEEFDPKKHKVGVNLVLRSTLAKRYRRDEDPKNTVNKARGRVDGVTYEGGGFRQIKVGEDIIITGHGLDLEKGEVVTIRYTDGGKREELNVGIFDNELKYFKKVAYDEIRLKWFVPAHAMQAMLKEGAKVTVAVRRHNLINGRWTIEPRGSICQVQVIGA